MYFFLYRSRYANGGHYYIPAMSLDEVLASCIHVSSLTYLGRVAVTQALIVGDSVNYYGVNYDPIHEFENNELRVSHCSRCTNPLCGRKQEPSRPLQGMYNRRKFTRYPGKSGEENEDE